MKTIPVIIEGQQRKGPPICRKGESECKDDLDKHYKARMASEYVAYYNNIYKYLRTKSEVVERIEKEVKTEGLVDFFDM